jgi:hypothetical protein
MQAQWTPSSGCQSKHVLRVRSGFEKGGDQIENKDTPIWKDCTHYVASPPGLLPGGYGTWQLGIIRYLKFVMQYPPNVTIYYITMSMQLTFWSSSQPLI